MPDAPRTIALIEWVDAGIVADRWTDEEKVIAEADRLTTGLIRSAGFLFRETDDHVILALSHNPNVDYAAVSLAMVIPRSAIRRMDLWSPFPDPGDGAAS